MSHHFDTPTAIEDGRLNLGDLYVFPASPGTSTLVVTVNPDAGRSNPTTFRPDALYEFVIASDGGTREDRAFRMTFGEPGADGNQEMRVRYATGSSSRSGTDGTELGAGRSGETFALGHGGAAWFGLAQDPLWGDAPALFAFTRALADNQYRPELFSGTPGNLLQRRGIRRPQGELALLQGRSAVRQVPGRGLHGRDTRSRCARVGNVAGWPERYGQPAA